MRNLLLLCNCIAYVYKQGHLFEFCKFYLYFIVMDPYNNEYFS